MNKRICMIAYSIFPYDSRIRRESETLTRYGHKIKFLVPAENNSPRKYEMNNVTVIELGMRKYIGKDKALIVLSYLKFLFLAFYTCSRLFLKRQVEVVHVHNMPNFLIFAGILPRIFGRKMILDVHDSVPETFRGRFGKLSEPFYRILCLEESICCALAHKVVCVNDVQREVLIKRGISAKKVAVLLNVPDHKIFEFDPERAQSYVNHKRTFNLVYHGTIDPMLGVDLAIEAVSHLTDRIPGIHFYILGKGRGLDQLICLARKLEIEDRVHFSRKNFPLEVLPTLLKEMDLGVIPNRKNVATDLMLPVKLLEYVAIGMPVVAARLRTIEHYFSEDMISYFEPENVKSMANAILNLYEDGTQRRQKTLRASMFLERFGWEKHHMDLIRLYQDL